MDYMLVLRKMLQCPLDPKAHILKEEWLFLRHPVGVLTMFLGFNWTRREQEIFLMLLFRVPFLLWKCQPLKHRYLLHHKTDSRPFAYVVSGSVLTIFSIFLCSGSWGLADLKEDCPSQGELILRDCKLTCEPAFDMQANQSWVHSHNLPPGIRPLQRRILSFCPNYPRARTWAIYCPGTTKLI